MNMRTSFHPIHAIPALLFAGCAPGVHQLHQQRREGGRTARPCRFADDRNERDRRGKSISSCPLAPSIHSTTSSTPGRNGIEFTISHADNIVVTYPDGHQTTELGVHLDELKPMFVFRTGYAHHQT